MKDASARRAVEAFCSAFQVNPQVERASSALGGLGVYLWKTPPIREFSLPEVDETVMALHLGGSRRVRAISSQGLSSDYSTPGMLTLLPAHQPVAFRTDGGVRLITVHIPQPLSDASAPEPAPIGSLGAIGYRFAFRDEFLAASAQALIRSVSIDADRRLEYFSTVATAMLCHLRLYTAPTPTALSMPADCFDLPLGNTSIAEVQHFIDTHLADKISLNDLAARTGLSRAWFAHNFKLGTGMSAHQFVSHRRVEAARRLLRESRLDLAAIAQEVGFSSQSHFTSVFRSIAGCTPGQYRDGAALGN